MMFIFLHTYRVHTVTMEVVQMAHKIILLDLPTTVRGFTKKTGDFYDIVLNARLSGETLKETYLHEMAHIMSGDFDSEEDAGELETLRHRSTPANGGFDGGEL